MIKKKYAKFHVGSGFFGGKGRVGTDTFLKDTASPILDQNRYQDLDSDQGKKFGPGS